MNVSEPFIRRPIATALAMCGLAAVGLVAYFLLPVAPLPQVDFPTIQVTAQLPGTSPETMASSVASPLERQLAQMSGVAQLTSVSGIGISVISVQFDLARNIDAAGQDVQAAINAATGQLPKNLPIAADLPQDQSVGPAGDGAGDDLGHAAAYRGERYGRQHVRAAAFAGRRRRSCADRGRRRSPLCGSKPIRSNSPDAASAWRICDRRSRPPRSTPPRARSMASGRAIRSRTTISLFNAAGYRPVIVAWRNGSPVRLGDVSDSGGRA